MRVSTGVYRDGYGYRVTWRDRGRQREKRFDADTPLDKLKQYRDRQTTAGKPAIDATPKGLARDIVRFLRFRKTLPCFKSDRAHLRAWLVLYPRLSRWALTSSHVREAIARWQAAGYAVREIQHRVRLLKQLYETLDGPHGSPCDGVKLPSAPKPRPIPVPDDLIRQVATQLRIQETKGIGRLRDAKTRARFLVLATTGQRPAQVMRAKPTDVDLETRVWVVRPAKGDRGTLLALNDDMMAAWTLFADARAWGTWDHPSFVKTLRRNGWPRGIRPYTMRHSVGMALSAANVELGDIQAHMGHQSPATTRAFYVPGLLHRQQAASAKIDGRIGLLPSRPAMTRPGQTQTNPEIPRHSATGQVRKKGPSVGARTSKTA